jgi:hypothetical protein
MLNVSVDPDDLGTFREFSNKARCWSACRKMTQATGSCRTSARLPPLSP